MSGRPDSACVRRQYDEQMKCWQPGNYSDHFSFSETQGSPSEKTYISPYGRIFSHISARIISPNEIRSFKLCTKFGLRSTSWVDVILTKSVDQPCELSMLFQLPSTNIPLSGKPFNLRTIITLDMKPDLMFKARKKFQKTEWNISFAVCASGFQTSYKSQETLSPWMAHSMMSMPGCDTFANTQILSLTEANMSKRYSLRVFALPASYKPFSFLQKHQEFTVQQRHLNENYCIAKPQIGRIPSCKQITYISSESENNERTNKTYLLLRKAGHWFDKCFHPRIEVYSFRFLFSWSEASRKCEEFDSNLPAFTCRDDLKSFMSMMKFVCEPICIEGIFVGLSVNNKNQVSQKIDFI